MTHETEPDIDTEIVKENTNVIYWRFAQSYEGRTDFLDPRLAIAKQMAWRNNRQTTTDYSIPEPDNFNRALVSAKWIECEFLEDQIMFYDRVRKSYISCYYVPAKQIKQFDAWVLTVGASAIWYHTNPPKVKKRREH